MVSKIINVVKSGSQALEAGKELQDTTVWKNRQRTSSLVLAVLLGIYAVAQVLFPAFSLEMGAIEEMSTVVAAVLALLGNWYLTTATTKRVGKKKKE